MKVLSPSTTEPAFTIDRTDLEQITAHARQDLTMLQDASLFLTGCTSFFGKWIVEALLFADHALALHLHLHLLTRHPHAMLQSLPHLASRPNVHFLKGDILDLPQLIADNLPHFTHIIHASNLPNDQTTAWPLAHMTAAFTGTQHLLHLATRCGCERFLLVSSGAIYNLCSTTKVTPRQEQEKTANDFLCEKNVYSLTKRMVETECVAYGTAHNVTIPIARCFCFAGAHMPLTGKQAIGNFISDILNHHDIVIKGDGRTQRSYLYAVDLVVWLLGILLRGRHGTPYNVGADSAVSIQELAEKMSQGSGQQVMMQNGEPSANAPAFYIPDTSRAHQELQLTTSVTLDDALARTIRWFQKLSTENLRHHYYE